METKKEIGSKDKLGPGMATSNRIGRNREGRACV
jgi:hypothetical protein